MPAGVFQLVIAPTNQPPMRRLLKFAAGVFGLLIIVSVAANSEQFETSGLRSTSTQSPVSGDRSVIDGVQAETVEPNEPIDIPQWIALPLAVGVGIGLVYLLSRQRFSFRFRRPSIRITASSPVEVSEEEQADAIADFARDLIDELNDGDSPRFAIQRAYAAVETGFGAKELVRKPAETPLRYLDRIFGRHQNVRAPLEQLTNLFQQARYSNEPIDESMRGDAIQALRELRDYYHGIAATKETNRRSKVRA